MCHKYKSEVGSSVIINFKNTSEGFLFIFMLNSKPYGKFSFSDALRRFYQSKVDEHSLKEKGQ